MTREMPVRIDAELNEDAAAVERLADSAFGPGRYAKTSQRVRELALLQRDLSPVAWVGGRLVGTCRISRIAIGTGHGLFLGPIAVDASMRGMGLGGRLVADGLERVAAAGDQPVLLIGAASFFAPHGFEPVPPGRIGTPGPVDPARLLWRGAGPDTAGTIARLR